MAKFKPHRVPVLLKGAPCDGVKTTALRTLDLLENVTCKGVEYGATGEVTKDGRVVYTTIASQQQQEQQAEAEVAKPTTAHHAWSHLTRTLFVDSPKELRAASQARAAIRRLRHRPGLR